MPVPTKTDSLDSNASSETAELAFQFHPQSQCLRTQFRRLAFPFSEIHSLTI